MAIKRSSRNWRTFAAAVIFFIIGYYIEIILCFWAHGVVAWLFGYKREFFDIEYGGWLLFQTYENVPYDRMIAEGRGYAAALIGISGVSLTIVLFLISLAVLHKIKHSKWLYLFFYWIAVLNMVPIIQYLFVQPFSIEGDSGRFIHGLDISPWWVFIPGVVIVGLFLYAMLKYVVPKAYVLIPIQSLEVQRIFLLITLCMMFLLIYTHGYNPVSEFWMPISGTSLTIVSILLIPLLFYFCNPSRPWVKLQLQKSKRKIDH